MVEKSSDVSQSSSLCESIFFFSSVSSFRRSSDSAINLLLLMAISEYLSVHMMRFADLCPSGRCPVTYLLERIKGDLGCIVRNAVLLALNPSSTVE